MKQAAFKFREHGGARKGAGRKPLNGKAGVSHRAREVVRTTTPVHVTLKMRREIWNLRSERLFARVRLALKLAAAQSDDFRVVQFSVQADHIHLLVEAMNRKALAVGMKGLAVRLARAINRVMRRSGPVLKDRYHAHVLRSVRETRNALVYVLLNARKHLAQVGRSIAKGWIDPCSSASSFSGWKQQIRIAPSELPQARSWFLTRGWLKLGLLDLNATPGSI